MEVKNETPSKSKGLLKVVPMSCDSPFRFLPNVSTPPSRFSKIFNPFEQHLIDRLHLPTFSPSVFAQVSTPKTEKFKWTIDDISSLKPADIDEATISQHVSDHDPTIESLVQEKIDMFFHDKVIVPSPFGESSKQAPLIPICGPKTESTDSSTQTVLTLPPILPKHVEDILAPYFCYSDDPNTSLCQKLFGFEEQECHGSPASSSAPSTGLSPIQFSPEFNPKHKLESSLEMPELSDCTLSPIGRSSLSRSVCRLNFSGHMSVDASMRVPDVNRSLDQTNCEPNVSFQPLEGPLNDLTVNWDMEYNHVSLLSSPEDAKADATTPRSKMFTSQRKRLSDSFRCEQEKDVEMVNEEMVSKKSKNVEGDVTESGYHTGVTICESSLIMFASTPTKHKL